LTSGVTAIAAGEFHTCALTSAGGVKCWGGTAEVELGHVTYPPTPTDVPGLTSGVAAIAAGDGFSCALLVSGGVKCWGGNQHGELGNGTTTDSATPVAVSGLGSNVAALATLGGSHACVLLTNGHAQCWGYNNMGQLGNNSTVDSPIPVDVVNLPPDVVAVTASGEAASCVLTSSGTVRCWGDIIGNSQPEPVPTDVSGFGGTVVEMCEGDYHACGLLGNGKVQCWGDNNAGELGDPKAPSSPSPVDIPGL
jgi:alpha-tubulin suppressor-like RCC1 family protein